MDEFRGDVDVVADVGGTHARFATIRDAEARLCAVQVYCCSDFDQIETMIEAYLSWLHRNSAARPASLCLAVAAAVTADPIKLTNLDWHFSRSALADRIDIPVTVLNDFAAQAHLLSRLCPEELQWIQRPAGYDDLSNEARLFRTVIGPGTGFGAATLTPAGEAADSEPGHCSFAPVTQHELELLQTGVLNGDLKAGSLTVAAGSRQRRLQLAPRPRRVVEPHPRHSRTKVLRTQVRAGSRNQLY